MLEATLKILIETNHPNTAEAMREIAVTLAAIKYFQIVLKRIDRDEKVIKDAIDFVSRRRNLDLTRKLKGLMEPVNVPYEELMT